MILFNKNKSRIILIIISIILGTSSAEVLIGEEGSSKKPSSKDSKKSNELLDKNFNFFKRSFVLEKKLLNIYVEKDMKSGDKQLYISSLAKLDKGISAAFSAMPEKCRNKLSEISIYLLWGESSPKGGFDTHDISYVRGKKIENRGSAESTYAMKHSILIYSALMLNKQYDISIKRILFHEFSHAWMMMNWPKSKNSVIKEAWENAKRKKKYIVTEYHSKGFKLISKKIVNISNKHRDRNNLQFELWKKKKLDIINNPYSFEELEYFAILSVKYFVGTSFYPHKKSKKKLFRSDRKGYRMIKKLWN
ncbi:MAG: hypothetical protein COA79_20900 [Planctomycetota bacterium]|nr:MAG: hypothetical protein COA79_20900 [Planctomycetota bacterium]